MLLAIGMTLVIATGGVDLSVGAIMAIAASVAGILMNPSALKNEVFFVTDPNYTFQPLWVVIIGGLAGVHPLWLVEWGVGRLHANPTHGGHADLDDFRPRNCPVDHQRAYGSRSPTDPMHSSARAGSSCHFRCISWPLCSPSPGS